MDKQEILKLIAEKIEEHHGLEGQFHLGATSALQDLFIEIGCSNLSIEEKHYYFDL